MFFHAIFIQLVKGILWMDFIIAYIAGRVKGAVIIYRVGGGGWRSFTKFCAGPKGWPYHYAGIQ